MRLRAFCRAQTESGLFKSGTQTTKEPGAADIPFVSATQVCGRPADPRSAFSTLACPLGLHWRLAIRFERQQPAAAGAEHTACCATAASEHSASRRHGLRSSHRSGNQRTSLPAKYAAWMLPRHSSDCSYGHFHSASCAHRVLCEQRKWPGSRLSRADAHLVVMHVSVGVVKPVVEYFGVKTARRLFPPLPLSVQPLASNSPSPFCLHNHSRVRCSAKMRRQQPHAPGSRAQLRGAFPTAAPPSSAQALSLPFSVSRSTGC